MESVIVSDDGSSSQGGDPMETDTQNCDATNAYCDDNTSDVLDQGKLTDLLVEGMEAGNRIEGKDTMLLIGGTGAGKVSDPSRMSSIQSQRDRV
jgi:hypothetical protein